LTAISAEGVSKRYRQYDAAPPRTLQEAAMSGFRHPLGRFKYFWGLRDVSFAVKRGEALGVIGRNGAGKSTLLRMLAGIGRPDEGQISVHGQLGGLLELTAGFHPDLTGRENAFVGGVIRGLTRAQVMQRLGSILDFCELHHVIDQPLRTYSSGMQMRLAFAVAIHADPEILLVDEVLAVGDAAFQKKCIERIVATKNGGRTVIMVSHDAALVQEMCDQALWLREGQVAAFGPASDVVDGYMRSLVHETGRRTPEAADSSVTSQGMVLVPGRNRFGSLDVTIDDVRVSTSDGSISELSHGHDVFVEMDYRAVNPVGSAIFCITVVDDGNKTRFTASTDQAGVAIPDPVSRGTVAATLQLPDLEPGIYFIDVGVYEGRWAYGYDYHSRVYPLIVRSDPSIVRAARGDAGRANWVHTMHNKS
jgi:lipopolysaccharide transport system ATP-binding protein